MFDPVLESLQGDLNVHGFRGQWQLGGDKGEASPLVEVFVRLAPYPRLILHFIAMSRVQPNAPVFNLGKGGIIRQRIVLKTLGIIYACVPENGALGLAVRSWYKSCTRFEWPRPRKNY